MPEKDGTFTDLDLVEKVKAGQVAAYSQLVKRHQRGLMRLCLRFMKDVDSAQDVAQEAFIKAYDRLGSFEARSSFKSWLFQIAVNTAKNKIRDDRGGQMVELEGVHLSVGPLAEEDLCQAQVAGTIRDLVDRLPERQRLAVSLRVYEDLSFKEIAELMDCPYDTAKANFRHGLMRLKEQIQTWDRSMMYRNDNQMVEVEG